MQICELCVRASSIKYFVHAKNHARLRHRWWTLIEFGPAVIAVYMYTRPTATVGGICSQEFQYYVRPAKSRV